MSTATRKSRALAAKVPALAPYDSDAVLAELVALSQVDTPDAAVEAFFEARASEFKSYTVLAGEAARSATVAAAYATALADFRNLFGSKEGQMTQEVWAAKYFGVGGPNVTKWRKAATALTDLRMNPKSREFLALVQAGSGDVTKVVAEAAKVVTRAADDAGERVIVDAPEGTPERQAQETARAEARLLAAEAARREVVPEIVEVVASHVDLDTRKLLTAEQRAEREGRALPTEAERKVESVKSALSKVLDLIASVTDDNGAPTVEGLDPETIYALCETFPDRLARGLAGSREAHSAYLTRTAEAEAEAERKRATIAAEAERMAAIEAKVASAEAAESAA